MKATIRCDSLISSKIATKQWEPQYKQLLLNEYELVETKEKDLKAVYEILYDLFTYIIFENNGKVTTVRITLVLNNTDVFRRIINISTKKAKDAFYELQLAINEIIKFIIRNSEDITISQCIKYTMGCDWYEKYKSKGV
ncbi:MAG: hypothetical protein PHY47_12650 [Lachnospiraceae bacterium]|nr:hypothetical protein [Lachnospiraceae bacterium]